MSDRPAPWLAIARYDAAGRARGSLAVAGLLSAALLLFLAFYPSLSTSGVDLDAYVEAFPPAVREAFGIIAISSVEGFLAVEFYQFAWLLLVGLYLAYLAGGTIAGDVASGRMDLTLSAPVARRDVVIGRFLGLVPLVALLNLVVPVVAYVGVLAVGETIAVERLVAVHALAVPYHLTCVAFGIAVSTLVSRPGIAQRVALGALFALFMLESVAASTDYAAVGDLSPTAHYDPSAVLVSGEYDSTGAAVLLAATVVLVALAVVRFRRADLSG
ncbi:MULTISPECIES: ABC transporter permease [Halorubrum]|uniref:ABC-2 type transport system permease protein n=1 Tax=Halorubrum sodomense TaxID=35743 RepID=A0A1I6H656_HALSD|nr:MULTISPECIES: ABC transporter permease subunit [Halorubrum]TKX55726.1 ABC transporter permease [Halorubrum sp. SP3]TKX71490.1 ABC transporter permease [Halorubrum sp. SP9]SFR49918.1 ABC-2 type transport system permease protein [Halorubrum sodomense]